MLKGATVVQNIITELSEAVIEEDKIMVITKMVLNATIHRPLKVVAFNVKGIWRQRYELSKQHIDVALHSETQLKPHESFFIPNYYFNRTCRFSGRKGGTAVAFRKGIPQNDVDMPQLVSVEAAGVSITIGNSEVLLAAVYKSLGLVHKNVRLSEVIVS
jgi:hypothetical protein